MINASNIIICMKNRKPNKETLEAIQEVEAMEKGLIKAKVYHSVDELMKDLTSDVEDTIN